MAATLEVIIKGSDQSGGVFGNLRGQLLGVGDIVNKALLGGLAAATTAIVGFGASGVMAAGDLDHQLAGIAAVLNTTKAEAAPLKDLMYDLALNPALTVTTNEAADAIEMLAANGLDMQQIMDGAALATVQLSNATGGDFTTAANLATDVMAQFGVEATDMSRVVDGLVGITNNSKWSLEDLAYAFANTGGIAGGMGLELEDLNAILAGTSYIFSSGMEQGTAFKTLLQRLADPTDKLSDVMQEYGVNLFDTNGMMKSGADIVEMMHKAFDGLTEAEKAELQTKLGGADASRIVLGLAKMTREEFEQLHGEINKQGQAAQNAATRVDSLRGAWDIMLGVIEAIQLKVGDALLPAVRSMTEGFTSFAIRAEPLVVGFFSELADAITQIAGSPALAELLDTIGQFIPSFDSAEGAVSGLSDILVGMANQVLPMLTQAVQFVADHWDEFKAGLVGVAVVLAGAGLASVLATVGTVIAALASPIGVVIAAVGLLSAAWVGNWGGIRDTLTAIWFGALQPALLDLWTWLQTNIPVAIQTLSDFWTGILLPAIQTAYDWISTNILPLFSGQLPESMAGAGASVQGAADFFNSTLLPALTAIYDFITINVQSAIAFMSQWWSDHGTSVMTVITGAMAMITTTITNTLTVIGAIVMAALTYIQALWDTWGSTIMTLASLAWDNIKIIVSGVLTQIGNIIDLFAAVITGDWQAVGDALKNIWQTTWQTVTGLLSNFTQGLLVIIQTWIGIVASTWLAFGEALRFVWELLWEAVKQLLSVARDNVILTINAFIASFSASWESFTATIGDLWDSLWSAVRSRLDSARTTLQTAINGLISTITGLWETFTGKLEAAWEAAWEAIRSAVNTAKTAVSGAIEGLIETITEIWDGITGSGEGSLLDKWNGLWDDIVGVVSSIAGDGSPLKTAFDTITGWLEDIIKLFEDFTQASDNAGNTPPPGDFTSSSSAGGDFTSKSGPLSPAGGGSVNNSQRTVTNNFYQTINAPVGSLDGEFELMASKAAAFA